MAVNNVTSKCSVFRCHEEFCETVDERAVLNVQRRTQNHISEEEIRRTEEHTSEEEIREQKHTSEEEIQSCTELAISDDAPKCAESAEQDAVFSMNQRRCYDAADESFMETHAEKIFNIVPGAQIVLDKFDTGQIDVSVDKEDNVFEYSSSFRMTDADTEAIDATRNQNSIFSSELFEGDLKQKTVSNLQIEENRFNKQIFKYVIVDRSHDVALSNPKIPIIDAKTKTYNKNFKRSESPSCVDDGMRATMDGQLHCGTVTSVRSPMDGHISVYQEQLGLVNASQRKAFSDLDKPDQHKQRARKRQNNLHKSNHPSRNVSDFDTNNICNETCRTRINVNANAAGNLIYTTSSYDTKNNYSIKLNEKSGGNSTDRMVVEPLFVDRLNRSNTNLYGKAGNISRNIGSPIIHIIYDDEHLNKQSIHNPKEVHHFHNKSVI